MFQRMVARAERVGVIRGFAALAAAYLLTGCAMGKFYLTDDGVRSVAPQVEPGRKATVAVLPFEVSAAAAKNRENVSKFERQYFASNLARVLGKAPHVASSFYAPAKTPSTDYFVDGRIVLSDGENTEVLVSLHSANGAVLFTETYGYANEPSDFAKPAYLEKLWFRPVNAIDRILEERGARRAEAKRDAEREGIVTSDVSLFRLAGYAGRDIPSEAVNQKIVRVVRDSARFETERLLAPLTRAIEARCEALKSRYVEWQRVSTRNAIIARENENQSRYSFFLALIGAAAAGAAQGSGDADGARRLQQQSEEAMNVALQQGSEADRRRELVGDLQTAFDANLEMEDIVLGGERMVLKGTVEQKMGQVHDLVRAIIRESFPETATAVPAPAPELRPAPADPGT